MGDLLGTQPGDDFPKVDSHQQVFAGSALINRGIKKHSDYIDLTDILFIPGGVILSYVISKWLPMPLAVALSVVLLLLVFSLFESPKGNLKRLAISAVLVGILVFTLSWLFDWPP